MTIEEMVKELAEKSGKSYEDVDKIAQNEFKKYNGLLDENATFEMIKKKIGLKENSEHIKITDAKDGQRGIDVKAKVISVYPPKEFEKNGKKGKLQSIILGDDSGEIRLTLWNDQTDKYEFNAGDEIEIVNAIIGTYNEKKQLSLGFDGKINVTKKMENVCTKISELKEGMNSVNIKGRIMRKFPCKEFESQGKKGKLCSFQIGDESAIIRATAWNEKAEEMSKFDEGEGIEIKNAYTKQGRLGVELNLGYSVAIKVAEGLPPVNEIVASKTEKKSISELVDGEDSVIEGEVTGINKGILRFFVCSKCNKKIGNSSVCETCGETKPKPIAVITAKLKDSTGEIPSTFFRQNALKLMQLTQEEFEKKLLEKGPDEIIAEAEDKVVGQKVKVLGYRKASSFSGENEFSAKEIIE
jgi:ssDNA-binding replication factor A large subunit